MSFHFFFANKGDFLLDKMRSILAISTSRKLSSYASYAMRIRRGSDDAELDVGFAGNAIDKQAIKDFGGSSDCFVTTLYDQSGQKNNATQTVATNQPTIYDVASGDLTKENGKPAMVFDGADDNLAISGVAEKSNIDAYFVNRHDETSTTATDSEIYLYPSGAGGTEFGFVGSKNSTTTSLNSLSYGSPNLYKNNTLLSPTNRGQVYSLIGQIQNIINHQGATTSSWAQYYYGQYALGGGVFHFEGTLQEIIIFDRNLTAKERTLLHSDINNHFNIY